MGANLLEEVRAMDECADRAVGAIGSEEELAVKQAGWARRILFEDSVKKVVNTPLTVGREYGIIYATYF